MNTLKRLLPLTLCLLTVGAAHADLIKSGAAYNRTVLITSSTDHISGATGLTAFTVTLSKAGGAVATITPTVTEIGAGRYSVALVTGNTGTLGALDMTITATGADPTDSHDQIVAFDPADSSLLGLTGVGTLANQTAIAAKTALIATNAMDSPNEVASQGQAGTTSTAVAALPAANATAVWGAAVKTITGGTAAASNLPADYLSTAEQASLVAAAANTSAATVTALLAASFITLPGTATTTGVGEVLTARQITALSDSVSGGDNVTSGPPVASGSATVTYYLRGQVHSSTTITEIATVNYDANKQQVSRTVKISQPFPNF